MKSVPKAFSDLRNREAEESRKTEEELERVLKARRAEEKSLCSSIAAALEPYNDVELDGKHVMVESKDRLVELFVDRNLWLTFSIERNFSRCSCENACDCIVTNWLTMRVVQNRRTSEYNCYFGCSLQELHDEVKVAESMAKMMNEFRMEFPKHARLPLTGGQEGGKM